MCVCVCVCVAWILTPLVQCGGGDEFAGDAANSDVGGVKYWTSAGDAFALSLVAEFGGLDVAGGSLHRPIVLVGRRRSADRPTD